MSRRVGLVCICAAVISLGGTASAQASLATLTVTPRQAPAGGLVVVSGTGYNAGAGSTPIEIRLDTRSGPVIASILPTPSFTTNATIPPATSVGFHLLVATQSLNTGVPAAGTPGRAKVLVTGAAAASATGSALPPPALSSTPGDGGGSPLGMLLGIALALALLGTGLKLAARGGSETANAPLLGG